MAALVKPAALRKCRRCDCNQMLRRQHAITSMSGKSALPLFMRIVANGYCPVRHQTPGLASLESTSLIKRAEFSTDDDDPINDRLPEPVLAWQNQNACESVPASLIAFL